MKPRFSLKSFCNLFHPEQRSPQKSFCGLFHVRLQAVSRETEDCFV
ncbi:MAG: hypothetical protein LBG87_04540 [Spirochaetaceae bacterium]|nr:hypothetical protein [Spirochaetaceae bacterium]